MPVFLRLLPIIISMLLLSAHFHRAGHPILAAGAILALFLLLLRRPRTVWLLQCLLVAGAAEWLRTAAQFISDRQTHGLPWLRLAIILGLVALFTLAAGLVFRTEALGEHYRIGRRERKRK
ncbi:hypothetical protein ACUUL3_13645 [Thiovibrio sp. JS02]